MGIPKIKNAIIRSTYGKTYFEVICPYCNGIHRYHIHTRNCFKSYKVAKCANNNEGYHYYIKFRHNELPY